MKKRRNLRGTEKTRRGRKEKSPASVAAFMIQVHTAFTEFGLI